MSAADWYPDPTRAGRLRYWDGSAWTSHVSENGEVASDPIPGIAPAPPRPDQAASGGAARREPAAPTSGDAVPDAAAQASAGLAGGLAGMLAPGGPGGPTTPGRIGFAVAAVGGIVAVFSQGRVAAEQSDPIQATITVGGGSWIGLVAAAACVGGALAPWLWGRVSAAVIGWLAGVFLTLAVIGFRTDDIFASDGDVGLGPAGVLMAVGALLLFAGVGLAVAGLRVPVTEASASAEASPREGKAIAALVSGIVGVLIPVAAPAAVALGLMARDDDVASGGKVGFRGMAVAGIVLGIVSMALWAVGLTLGMFLAMP